jgi:hypothetical protein
MGRWKLLLLLLRCRRLTPDTKRVIAHVDLELSLLVARNLELDDKLVFGLVDVSRRNERRSQPAIFAKEPGPAPRRLELPQRVPSHDGHFSSFQVGLR